jgi:hypothetical protein
MHKQSFVEIKINDSIKELLVVGYFRLEFTTIRTHD